jgi:hypothetical protein
MGTCIGSSAGHLQEKKHCGAVTAREAVSICPSVLPVRLAAFIYSDLEAPPSTAAARKLCFHPTCSTLSHWNACGDDSSIPSCSDASSQTIRRLPWRPLLAISMALPHAASSRSCASSPWNPRHR